MCREAKNHRNSGQTNVVPACPDKLKAAILSMYNCNTQTPHRILLYCQYTHQDNLLMSPDLHFPGLKETHIKRLRRKTHFYYYDNIGIITLKKPHTEVRILRLYSKFCICPFFEFLNIPQSYFFPVF